MRTLIITPSKVRKVIPLLKQRLKVNAAIKAKTITLSGEELNEFIAEQIVRAVDFGFNEEDSLLLLNEDYMLEFINIKQNTKKKDLRTVRARIIGRDGRAKGTIAELTGSIIVVNANQVGIIADSEHIDSVIQGITSIIHGAKHSNVFSYLEKQNVNLRKLDDDLGLKDSQLKNKNL